MNVLAMHSLAPRSFEVPSGISAVVTFEPAPYAWSVKNTMHITFSGQPTREDIRFAEREADRLWTHSYYPEREQRLQPPVFATQITEGTDLPWLPQAVYPDASPRAQERGHLAGMVTQVFPPPPLSRPKPTHLRLVPALSGETPEQETFEDENVEPRHCETCGRIRGEHESGFFVRDIGEGYDPDDGDR